MSVETSECIDPSMDRAEQAAIYILEHFETPEGQLRQARACMGVPEIAAEFPTRLRALALNALADTLEGESADA
jgi:hypothetical protein